MPRPYQATPRVAHRSEAMPRPQSFVEAPPGPGDACSGEAWPRPYDIHIREHESGARCGRPVGRPYDPVSALVGTFGARMRATLPAILFVGLMVLLAYPIGTAATPLTLFLVLPVFAAIPIAWLPVFLGALVRLDPSGRFAAANPAFVTMGGALAPMITGFIADRAGFPVLGIFTACAILVGLALYLLTCVKADRLER